MMLVKKLEQDVIFNDVEYFTELFNYGSKLERGQGEEWAEE